MWENPNPDFRIKKRILRVFFWGGGGANPKADHESIKSTFSSDSSDQIQIRIFEIHNLSVFFLGKDLKKVVLTERFFEKKKWYA